MFTFLKSGEGKASGTGLLWILLAAAVGIALILIGGASEHTETEKAGAPVRTDGEELIEYQEYLEERIRKICESVSGVERATVTVTLSGGFESVYATEWKDGNEKYVILGSGSSASALYLTRATPEIAGIGIVCESQSLERVRCELVSLLGATFNVSTHRIYVTAAK